jgi:hypothetical protein
MGCLIKMVKEKGGIKGIAFIRLDKAMKKDKQKQKKEPNRKRLNKK